MAITQNYVDYGGGSDLTGDGTVGTPWKTLQKALDTVTRNTTDGNQINLKAGTAHVNAAALDLTTFVVGGALSWNAPLVLRGYTSAANDGGIGEIDCGGAVFLTAIHNFLTLIDLEIHTFGNNTGISVGHFTYIINCEIHKGASSPSGKYLVYSQGTVVLDRCYLHDAGTSGTCIFAFGGTVVLQNSFLTGGGTWLADLRVPGRVQNCIFRVDADANGVRFYAVADRTEVVSCIFYSSNGTAGALLVSSGGNYLNQIVNNIFVGGGANAVTADRDVAVCGYNAFYGNVGNYSLSDQIRVDWTAHDVTLAANPFTDAPNGDFSLTIAGKAALRGLGWTAAYLGAHANTDGHVTIGPIQYGEAEAAADYPAESDVRLGVDYDSGGSTGTLDLPAVADVQSGVTFDGATKTGTFVSPAVGDVQSAVTYGAAAQYTGTLALPTEAQVESGVGFGAGGTEFTGSLVGGSDWTDSEKQQIRQALGITGTKAATSGGNLDTVLTSVGDLATDEELAALIVDGGPITTLAGAVVQTNSVSGSIGGDVAGKVLGGGAGVLAGVGVQADMQQMDGSTTPVDNLVLAIESDGYIRANLVQILGTALTETAGLIAAAFSKFFNKAVPTGTVNSLPDAVAGAAGGVAIVGSQMDLVNAPNATAVAAIQAGLMTLGSGTITFTYTLQSSVDASPIADTDVWVTTDSAGTNVIAVGRTNAAGEVVFYLDAGTVYVWRQKTGWTFTNPDTEVVA